MSNRPNRKQARPRAQQRAAEAEASANRNRMLLIGGGVAIVLVALVLALTIGSGDDGESEASADIAFNGPSLPTYSDAGPDPAIGERAPIFVTDDFSGQNYVVGSGGGPNDPARIVGFFAHWCPVCQAELPLLADYLNEVGLPDMVEVHAVSTFEDASRDNYPPADWFAETNWPYPAFSDPDGEIAAAFGMNPVPSWVVMDNFNRVIVRTTGVLTEAQFQALIDQAEGSIR